MRKIRVTITDGYSKSFPYEAKWTHNGCKSAAVFETHREAMNYIIGRFGRFANIVDKTTD